MTRPSPLSEQTPPQVFPASAPDWDARFSVIQSRLRQAVGEQLDAAPVAVGDFSGLDRSLVQAIVLDCVEGLEQLHQVLIHERGQAGAAEPQAPMPPLFSTQNGFSPDEAGASSYQNNSES